MSSKKALLREGQKRIIEAALEMRRGILTAQLPTGYGKTKAAVATYAALEETGEVNRLLYLVSTDPQRQQFCNDGKSDFAWIGRQGVTPFDVSYSPILALKEHRNNKSTVFCTSVQSLVVGSTLQTIQDLLATGRWMVVVDEYHHYAMSKAWGKVVRGLNAVFLLAMSATPERRDQDSAFGEPMIRMSYIDALKEGAVKRLILHAYEYRIDAIMVNGETYSFTTTDLFEQVGSDEPDAIDHFMLSRKMRWSPKYVSPLVSIPVERLLNNRLKTGLPLQMIISAMCCTHAQTVYEQVQAMFGSLLRVEWVGTGRNGRSGEENKAIIRKFCPPKNARGERNPGDIALDILIHVGMAGEGLDSVFVSEVVHLHNPRICNKEDQENGRAARRIPGIENAFQEATINVDSASEYAEWSGGRVMQVLDRQNGDPPPEEEEEESTPREYEELPDEPHVLIANMELLNIDKGDPEVHAWFKILGEVTGASLQTVAEAMQDTEHPLWDRALEARRKELLDRAQGMNRMVTLGQLRQQIDTAAHKVAHLIIRKKTPGGFDKKDLGNMCRTINQRKKHFFGDVKDADEESLRQHYHWIKELEQAVIKGDMPAWLR
jgi:Type III restriction enzyme, res subunit